MAGNRTLEDFLDPDDTGPAGDPAGGTTADDADADADLEAEPDPEPPASDGTGDGPEGAPSPLRTTYAWSPVGAACEACGAPADRRWRDGDRFVCADCKAW